MRGDFAKDLKSLKILGKLTQHLAHVAVLSDIIFLYIAN